VGPTADDGAGAAGFRLGHAPTALAMVDADGVLVEANPGVCALFGWDTAPLGSRVADVLGLAPGPAGALVPGGTMQPVECTVPGTSTAVEVTPAPVTLPDDVSGVVLHFRRIPTDRRFEQMVLEAHDLLGEGVIVGDGRRVLHVNDAACRIFGYRREDLLVMPSLFDLFRPDEQERITGTIAAMTASGLTPPDRWETVIVRAGGDELEVEVSIKAVVAHDATRTLTIIRDNSERRRAEQELTRRALHDDLTGLPLRALFSDRFRRALARARRDGTVGALLFCDLDGFKSVNDELGHLVGDIVLVAVAERIGRTVRDQDTVARLGGDEFVVVCEGIDDRARADDLAHRIAAAVSEPIDTGLATTSITLSIGVQLFGADQLEPGEHLHQADQAMYATKRSRRVVEGVVPPVDPAV